MAPSTIPTESAELEIVPSNVRQTYEDDISDDEEDLQVFNRIEGPKGRGRGRGRDSISLLLPRGDGDEEAELEFKPWWREQLKAHEGLLLVAASQAAFAIVNLMVKILQTIVRVPTWEIIWIRMTVTLLGCYTWMHAIKLEHPFLGPPGIRLLLCVRGVSGFFGLFGIYYALQYLSLSDATTLSFISPLLTGFFAWILLGEKYSLRTFIVSVTSLFGVVLVAKPSFLFSQPSVINGPTGLPVTLRERELAIICSLIGCVGAAGAYVSIRRIGKRANALHIISYFSIFCVIVSTLYPCIIDDPPVFIFSVQFFAYLLPVGIFGFIAQALLTMGLQRETASRASLAIYSLLIFSIVAEYTVFDIVPDLWSILGAATIIGGGILIVREKAQKMPER